MDAEGNEVLRRIRSWLGEKTRVGEKVQPAGAPSFEPLEPRLLLSANLIEPVPLSPPDAPFGGDAIHVALSQQSEGGQGQQTLELFSTSPALFVENLGQWSDPSVRYVHDGSSMDVALTESEVRLLATKREPTPGGDSSDAAPWEHDPRGTEDADFQAIQFSASFVGAEEVQPEGLKPSSSTFNYFVGDQTNWRAEVPSYEELYEGVDLYVQGLRSHLKYEFHVAPTADYHQIAVRYEGIDGLSMAEDGSLVVDLGGEWGVIQDDAPYIYQEIDGRRSEVGGRFVVLDNHTYSFELTGTVDPEHELVIDPDLAWSTYLGGSSNDYGRGVAVDASGGVYVTGYSESSGWTSGGFDTTLDGPVDAFVAKLSSSGEHLWSTYLGGSSNDFAQGIGVDASGSVYVAGHTRSSGWTSGGFDTTLDGTLDAFVAKLSASGEHLWSTYLGGSSVDYGLGIAVDASGGVYVTGRTESSGWTSGGFDTTYNGTVDAFVAKVSAGGAHLWSSYLGGSASAVSSNLVS